jgi:hypothetical protein
MSVISVLMRLRQEDLEFKAILGYLVSSVLAWNKYQDPVSKKIN